MSTANVHVSYCSFTVLDGSEWDVDSEVRTTGLVGVMSTGATIITGMSTGPVQVTAEYRPSEPVHPDQYEAAGIDPGPWDEIVEVSVNAPLGDLQVGHFEDRPAAGLPLLSQAGPGTYRLRAHARRRDIHAGEILMPPEDWDEYPPDEDPNYPEEHLLIVWPAPPQPDNIIRVSDDVGLAFRMGEIGGDEGWPLLDPPADTSPG
jgi:hypothetical protein